MIGGKKEISANKGVAIDNSGKGNSVHITVAKATKLTSLLNPILEKIIEEHDRIEKHEARKNYGSEDILNLETKITFNSVQVHAEELRDSAGYMSLIEELIDSIDDEKPKAKETFLNAIKRNYNNHKKTLLINHATNPQDTDAVQKLICANADKLIQAVAKTILEHAEGDLEHSVEFVQFAQELLVGYGFINCKILEKPQ